MKRKTGTIPLIWLNADPQEIQFKIRLASCVPNKHLFPWLTIHMKPQIRMYTYNAYTNHRLLTSLITTSIHNIEPIISPFHISISKVSQ